MTTIIIILLLLLGTLLIVAELLLVPGITIAGFGAIASFIASITISYINYGFNIAIGALIVSIALSTITLIICTRRKSLHKISLNEAIDSKTSTSADKVVEIGAIITCSTRLAPIGNVIIDGNTYQAKSISGYIEPKTDVEVVGYDDYMIIVKESK